MRKVIFGGANSLDNYFARKDESVDWLMWSNEVSEVMSDYWKRFDTLVMGRRTYEFAVRSGQGGKSYAGMKTYIFSRTLKPVTKKNFQITSEDVADVISRLKQEEGKDICIMGGGNLAKSLFEADLIDEIGFNIHPVLLGSGIPLFYEMDHQIDLELLECRALKNGCVLVTYKVKPSTSSAKKARKSRKQSKTKKA